MITRLRLQNFRRHEHTEIRFDDSAQVVLIAGNNGCGKTTMLEAITYAMYGEGRHGSKRLTGLVRRGAELEGLEVELEFTLAGTSYHIHRRRTKSAVFAQLFVDGHPLAETQEGVTKEVSRILGMDAAGFRLSVIAQQKELDKLSDHQPKVRAQMLSRLLRLDAITRAKKAAASKYTAEKSIVEALGPYEDVETLTAEVAAAEAAEAAARQALEDSRAAVVEIEAELAQTADVEEKYQKALTATARAEGVLTSTQAEVDRLQAELRELRIPDAVERPAQTDEELSQQAADVERQLARAEEREQLARQVQGMQSELEQVTSRLAALRAELGDSDPKQAQEQVDKARERVTELSRELTATRESREALAGEWGQINGQVKSLQAALGKSEQLGAECSECGQQISEEHRHSQRDKLHSELQAAQAALAEIGERGQAASKHSSEVEAAVETARAAVEAAVEQQRIDDGKRREIVELERRKGHYTDQIARLDVTPVDTAALYARKAELAILIAQARQAEDRARQRDAAQARQREIIEALERATARLDAAKEQLAAATVNTTLQQAYERRRARKQAKAEEMTLMSECAQHLGVASGRVSAAKDAVSRALQSVERRRRHEKIAVNAANAKLLLEDVESNLATQVRPAMEGAIAALLSTLSDGRYSQVKVDENYSVHVFDEGSFRPIEEFSGGEQDLIALAVRLALAGIVADRHGSGGCGFLILDECFGSQDPARREAIMTALRNLRNTYGQIFLISHVGGLEDAADKVINVVPQTTEDGLVADVIAA